MCFACTLKIKIHKDTKLKKIKEKNLIKQKYKKKSPFFAASWVVEIYLKITIILNCLVFFKN